MPSTSQAQLSSWISPGKLSSPHIDYEGLRNCTQCHSTAKGIPNKKCLDCHKEIQSKLNRNHGYHAAQSETCAYCHSEHKGRNYDLMGLDRIKFSHDETGWKLTGKHKKAKCLDCHTQKRKHAVTGKPTKRTTYLDANPKCVTCHPDIHKSKKKKFKRCQNCHHSFGFKSLIKNIRFNHNRETQYPLTGAHKKVKCKQCHSKNRWAPIAFAKCTNCHSDPHKGKFGKNCTNCHNTESWYDDKSLRASLQKAGSFGDFDHQKTRFPLTGLHKDVDCKTCHGDTIGPMQNFAQCDGCHNNPHGKQFEQRWKKKQCTTCHFTEGWDKLQFLHNKDSRYKLKGQHEKVDCRQCHIKTKVQKRIIVKGQKTQLQSYETVLYRWLNKTPPCEYCHSDVHKGQFKNQKCTACHTNYEGFNNVIFDHNKQSQFKLDGKHKYVKCSSCHPYGQYKPLKTNCSNCHNDFHKGELGKKCSACHNANAFNAIRFDHNKSSDYPLTGQHQYLACNQCHIKYRYKIKLKECKDCHLDVHDNSFGPNCQRCHNTVSFNVNKDYHDFGEYQLGGAHDRLNCLNCHSPNNTLRPLQQQCASCHADPHANSFGGLCQDCHQQNNWLPTEFRHQLTGFELSGAHRFVDCQDCHFNRVFGGLPTECSFCHLKNFAPPSIVPAHASGNINCQDCHRTFGWRPTR